VTVYMSASSGAQTRIMQHGGYPKVKHLPERHSLRLRRTGECVPDMPERQSKDAGTGPYGTRPHEEKVKKERGALRNGCQHSLLLNPLERWWVVMDLNHRPTG
jgi:hypothetical protein